MNVEVANRILADTMSVVNEFYRKGMPENIDTEVSNMIQQLDDIA